jgi:hypothetical protein
MRKPMRLVVLLTIVVSTCTIATAAHAQVHINVPSNRQPPIYANFNRDFMSHDDEWAVVFFYRPPACVPADFNLLDWFDFSGNPFRPGCDLLFEGHANWRSLGDPYPADSVFHGTGAVPAWFVRWPELQAAVADDVVTVGELAELPSLVIGTASFYLESIRNDIRGSRGGNEALVAFGTLDDGRLFQVELTERLLDSEHFFHQVRIDFR